MNLRQVATCLQSSFVLTVLWLVCTLKGEISTLLSYDKLPVNCLPLALFDGFTTGSKMMGWNRDHGVCKLVFVTWKLVWPTLKAVFLGWYLFCNSSSYLPYLAAVLFFFCFYRFKLTQDRLTSQQISMCNIFHVILWCTKLWNSKKNA